MLNKEQLTAIESEHRRILLLAAAGAGKTKTLIERISRLVQQGHCSPDRILALTFTNAAAFEMKSRYRENNPGREMPMFCTFHGFCYSLLINDVGVRAALGYTDMPSIIDENDLTKLQATVRTKCGVKLPQNQLGIVKPNLAPKDEFPYKLYWKALLAELRNSNRISFDVLCYKVCELFTKSDPCIVGYKSFYRYLLTDEFQDTDPAQWSFVQSFTDSALFIVGDPKQAIYGFRGADSSIIKSVAENPDWEVIQLTKNYRSTRQICGFSNAIHSKWSGSKYNLVMQGQKDGGEVREICGVCTDHLFSTEGIIGVQKSTAVLCRTNAEVDAIKLRLDREGVVYQSRRNNRNAQNILKSVNNQEYLRDWLSSCLSVHDYLSWVKLCTVNPKYSTPSAFVSQYGTVWGITDKLHLVNRIEQIAVSDEELQEKYTRICGILGLTTDKTYSPESADTVETMFDYLLTLSNQYEVSVEGVYVGTIHSVKGLEFDRVFLCGVGGKQFDLKTEELLNLYYVGCTRARSELTIYRDK
jgi:superfamily I DNA/RNA helicase